MMLRRIMKAQRPKKKEGERKSKKEEDSNLGQEASPPSSRKQIL